VAFDDLVRDTTLEETPLRVALSLLEESGLICRYQDVPRAAALWLMPEADGHGPDRAAFDAFARSARLRRDSQSDCDLLDVAARAGLDPRLIEQQVLQWADRGWLGYESSGHDMLVEQLRRPSDAGERVRSLLEEYEAVRDQKTDEIVSYAETKRCRHAHIGAYLSGQSQERCTACDICQPDRRSERQPALRLPDEMTQLATILRCAVEAPHAWGKVSLIRILHGDAKAPEQGQRCAQFGALAFRSAAAVANLVGRLVEGGWLVPRTLEHGGVVLDPSPVVRTALPDSKRLAQLLSLACAAKQGE